jgi:hypothetical protein
MASGQVVLNGRFKAGTEVRLVKVRDESVLRAEGGEEVATATVDDGGRVEFKRGVEVGARYFIVGQVDGFPLEVRARGREAGDESAVLEQPPIGPDRRKLADGRFVDELGDREKTPSSAVGPAPGQHQVAKGVQQRSDTPLGVATPVDPDEQAPYPGQDDVKKSTDQRSDTERGQATPVVHQAALPQSEDGGPQRSDTERGVATPIPAGDAVQAQLDRESAGTKAAIGEPVKAAALPEDAASSPKRKVSRVDPEPQPGAGDESGLDAQGQPADEAVAAVVGVEPADKPAEPIRTRK